MQNNDVNKEIKNNKLGGKLIASGGFGCVFSPALKCEGSNKRVKNNISKLMTNKNAKEEYNELLNVREKLKNLENYKDYYLIDNFTLCKPSKLTKNDLVNLNKCGALKKKNITSKNINKSLNNLLALNMPYGGITIDKFITNKKNYNKIVEINNKLINLLKYGILQMNAKNIYHNDIKSSNILVNEFDGHDSIEERDAKMETRLIDWSLVVEYIPFKNNKFPDNWRNRPLQFNVPFSVILFTDLFIDSYSKYLDEIDKNKHNNKTSLTKFVQNYLMAWFDERGLGHYKYINKIMYMLFYHDVTGYAGADDTDVDNAAEYSNNSKTNKMRNDTETENDNIKKYIEKKYTIPYIINYLVEVLLHFTKFKSDGSLNLRIYLDTIFIKIVDVWGFIISYIPLYELLFANYNNLTKNQLLVLTKLKKVFLKYLYEPRIQPINIENLEYDLKEINRLIE